MLHTLNGISLWCLRRLKQQDDVGWQLQPLGFMCPGLIQLDDEHAVFVLLTHQSEKHLETIAVEMRELVVEMCSRGGFDAAVEVSGLELPLHFAFGFDALRGMTLFLAIKYHIA